MDFDLQDKRSSSQRKSTRLPKEKSEPKPIRESRSVKLGDEIRGLKPRNLWPNSKEAEEELIKHMSNVPYYLQKAEQGDNAQQKALNFGVIDWGQLEKWAVNRSRGESPSTGDRSYSFSTFGSSTQSRRSIGSSLDQRKKSTPFEPTTLDGRRPVGLGRNSFSGSFVREATQFTNPSPYIPSSAPLTTDRNDVPQRASAPVSGIGVRITKPKGKYEAEASKEIGEELSPTLSSPTGLNWMKRSSSLRVDLSIGQTKRNACPEPNANNRDRPSPLRRLLDPLLKLKSHTPRPTIPLTEMSRVPEEFRSRHRPSKSLVDTIDLSTSQKRGTLNSSNPVAVGSHERMRQAILQLTWKNETPMLMLSTDDGNVLAATMRKKSFTNKESSECIFIISSIHEVKKKSGVWISHGNQSRKHRLISNAIGQLKVSSPKLKGRFSLREFELFGAELTPVSHEPLTSIPNSELAAIIINIPEEEKTSSCQEGSITALLPAKVHGLPVTGQPSPLLVRWKSGGVCDCGGWDEGCVLTVLTDKLPESKSSGSTGDSPAMDGSDRIELFVQGRRRGNTEAFNMVGRKEGVYTVEFSPSIDLLQAFAISIATLYSRKLCNPSLVREPEESRSFEEAQGGAPTSYVPHHPPLSPVGRA